MHGQNPPPGRPRAVRPVRRGPRPAIVGACPRSKPPPPSRPGPARPSRGAPRRRGRLGPRTGTRHRGERGRAGPDRRVRRGGGGGLGGGAPAGKGGGGPPPSRGR